MRRIGWYIMTVLAITIGAYAAAVLAVPAWRAPFVRERVDVMPFAVYAHLAGGTLAMVLGPFQFSPRLRANYLNVHRWMGRTYVTAVAIGGIGALIMAPISQFGLPTHVGFGMLGVLWLVTTGLAYRFIRAGDSVTHRRWMIRSYALTYAAVTLRIWIPLGLAFHVPFEPLYVTVSWFCWVPNLVAAEWLILGEPATPRRTVSRAAIVSS